MKKIKQLEERVERLEKRAGLLDVFSARSRKLKSEEKALKKRFESLSGIDFSTVQIDSKTEEYRGLKLNDMTLKVSYRGEVYDLVGKRVESTIRKRVATPYFFFSPTRNKRPSVSVSQLSRGVGKFEDSTEVHYKISFPKRMGYSVKIFEDGRGDDIRSMFGKNLFIFRGY